MRCKNCGFENEAERHICENCGSPLYDEGEEITAAQAGYSEEQNDSYEDKIDKRNTRNSIIVIVILAVLLIAMVTGIAVLASGGKTSDEPSSDGVSTTEPADTSSTTEPATEKQTTTQPATAAATEPATEKTTEPATEPTTEITTKETEPAVAEYKIVVDIDGNGTVTGDGTYEAGNKATLTAAASEGSQFAGWYDNSTGNLVASSPNYTVTVQRDLSLTARFEVITTEKETEPETEEAEKTEDAETDDKEKEASADDAPIEDDPVIEQG